MTNYLTKKESNRRGLTLVELLVVISILAILTAMIIPRLRMLNRDRAIREAARVVGSTVAKAVSRATLDDGEFAGIAIERNPNIAEIFNYDGTDRLVHFAGTRLYVLRSIAPYAGDDFNETTLDVVWQPTGVPANGTYPAFPVPHLEVRITKPIEHDFTSNEISRQIVRAGDRISFNHGAVKYPVERVEEDVSTPDPTVMILRVTLGLGSNLPLMTTPLSPVTLPFLVHRRPRRLESSKVDLPEGFMIDLRLSGPALLPELIRPNAGSSSFAIANAADPTTVCRQMSAFGQETTEIYADGSQLIVNNDIEILFNKDGAIDSVQFGHATARDTVIAARGIPLDLVHLFVTEYKESSHSAPDSTLSSLYDPDAMWVTIDYRNGSTNIAYNVPPPGPVAGVTFREGLDYARGFATGKRSADQ